MNCCYGFIIIMFINNDEEYDAEIIAIHNKVHEIWAYDLLKLFFTDDGGLWDLVNASSHFRKANLSKIAIEKLNVNRKCIYQQDKKSRLVYYSTLGMASVILVSGVKH